MPPDDTHAIRYRLRLKPGREKSVQRRHPWIFSGAVQEVEALEDASPGDLGDVVDTQGRFLARGTVQPGSQIVCRLLTWDARPIDTAFFREKIERAYELRQDLLDLEQTNAYRVVNAEGDELPGLVVDRYGASLAVQTLTSGMHRMQSRWLDALAEVLRPQAILERGERARREAVGQGEPSAAILRGMLPEGPIWILENGLRYRVDLRGGQKTGFYLDQRDNRVWIRRLAEGKEVLNLFGYTGAFSVAAGMGGAHHVVQVETSERARNLAVESWLGNRLPRENLDLVDADAFEYVRRNEDQFDLILIDPPPLARSRSALDAALRAYKDLNLWAFCRTRPGSILATFSCSQHVSPDLFQKVIFGAAHDVGASVQWVARLGAGIDHPVHMNHPQGEYLKGFLLRVIRPGQPPASRRTRRPEPR